MGDDGRSPQRNHIHEERQGLIRVASLASFWNRLSSAATSLKEWQ